MTFQRALLADDENAALAELKTAAATEQPPVMGSDENMTSSTPPPPPPSPAATNENETKLTLTGYRGVARHRISGRYESHVWLDGRQLYLGTFDKEVEAARQHDRMLIHLKMSGGKSDKSTAPPQLNFPVADYADELHMLTSSTKEEILARMRRGSAGFARGTSTYRGVSFRSSTGRYEARIGRLLGRKYSYLGTFATGEAAARAYDRAAIVSRGRDAITNFSLDDYPEELMRVESATPEERLEMERALVSRSDVADALCRRKRVDSIKATATKIAGGMATAKLAVEPASTTTTATTTASAATMPQAQSDAAAPAPAAAPASPCYEESDEHVLTRTDSLTLRASEHISMTLSNVPPRSLLAALTHGESGQLVQGVMGVQGRRFKRVRSAPPALKAAAVPRAPQPLKGVASANLEGAQPVYLHEAEHEYFIALQRSSTYAVGALPRTWQRTPDALTELPTCRHPPAMPVDVDALKRREAELAREHEAVCRALDKAKGGGAPMVDMHPRPPPPPSEPDMDEDILPDLDVLLGVPLPPLKRRASGLELHEDVAAWMF